MTFFAYNSLAKALLLGCLMLAATAAQSKEKESHLRRALQEATKDERNRELIIGGAFAGAGRHPYYVQLQAGFEGGATKDCGGSLITKNLVLTAASCLYDGNNAAVTSSGQAWIGNLDSKSGGTNTGWNDYAVFPGYDPSPGREFIANVAVIELASDIETTYAQLNSDSSLPAIGADVNIMGFGFTTAIGSPSDMLKTVTIDVVDSENPGCQLLTATLDSNYICASRLPIGTNTPCQGDEGGPLVDANGVQYGIYSHNDLCAGTGPSAFSRVSFFKTWIDTQACLLSAENCADLCCSERIRIAALRLARKAPAAWRNYFG